MSDRLDDLKRQRALAQEQLAWFEREIARATGSQPLSPAPQNLPAPRPVADVEADAEKIIAKYHPEKAIKDTVRNGCLMYFFAAFALVGLGVALLYLYHHTR